MSRSCGACITRRAAFSSARPDPAIARGERVVLSLFQRKVKVADAEQALMAGDADKALALYERVVVGDPGDLKARRALADLYRQKERPNDAIRELEAIASAYAVQGLLLRAIGAAKTILEIDPTHTATEELLARLYAEKQGGSADLDDAIHRAKTVPPISVETELSEDDIVAEQEDALEIDDASIVHADVEVAADDLVIDERQASGPNVRAPAATDPPAPAMPTSLPKSPLFSALPKAAFRGLLSALDVKSFAAGDVVVKEGAVGDEMFVLASGAARVERHTDDGPRSLGDLKEGDFFGELALFGRVRRSATVVVTEPATVLVLPQAAKDALIQKHPRTKTILWKFARERLTATLAKTSPLFDGVAPDVIEEALTAFRFAKIPMGHALVEQGKKGRALSLVLAGALEVARQNAAGDVATVAELGPGDVVGEIALLTKKGATATVTALSPTLVLRLSSTTFHKFVARHPLFHDRLRALADERTHDETIHGEDTARHAIA